MKKLLKNVVAICSLLAVVLIICNEKAIKTLPGLREGAWRKNQGMQDSQAL